MKKVLFLLSFLIASVVSFAQVTYVYVQPTYISHNTFIEITCTDGSKGTYTYSVAPYWTERKLKLREVGTNKKKRIKVEDVQSFKLWNGNDKENVLYVYRTENYVYRDRQKKTSSLIFPIMEKDGVGVFGCFEVLYFDKNDKLHIVNGGQLVSIGEDKTPTYFYGNLKPADASDDTRKEWVGQALFFFGDDPVLKSDLEMGVFDKKLSLEQLVREYHPTNKK